MPVPSGGQSRRRRLILLKLQPISVFFENPEIRFEHSQRLLGVERVGTSSP